MESLRFSAGTLSLEGEIAVPSGARHGIVICHPHPEYGGSMHNNVVDGVVAAAERAGVACLRFNFRGVGASEGRHSGALDETADALGAAACLRERAGLGSVMLAGYSFGAMIALLAGCDEPSIERIAAIALPATMFDVGFLSSCTKPKLFLLGDRDPYCPYGTLEGIVETLPGEARLVRLRNADHFLAGFETEIGDRVARFATGRGGES